MSKFLLRFCFLLFVVSVLSACSLDFLNKPLTGTGKTSSNEAEKAVKLDFYVMSQCPYGTQVEDAIAPVMKQMGESVDLNINYILYPRTAYADDPQTYCIGDLCSMHGTPEVKGNIVQLCVNKIAPEKHLDFLLCQNKNMQAIPGNWESCATELGLDKNKIETCYTGKDGEALLAENKLLADAVNATGSPTIYLNDQQYSGGRTSLDFQRAICQSLGGTHPACVDLPVCSIDNDCNAEADKIGKCVNPGTKESVCQYAEPTIVEYVILTDKRCNAPECQAEPWIERLNSSFKGVKMLAQYDYNSEEGKALFESTQVKTLPAVLFTESVTTAYFYNELKQYLTASGEYYQIMINATFDPTKEICDNQIDDTGNGDIDCADTDCAGQKVCRLETKAKLDLFVMSQCPYGTKALDVMPPVLDAFKGELDFNVHYIANEIEPGKFQSLHGQPEVDENIRELCAINNSKTKYQYMDYIVCRNKNITSTAWEGCAKEAGFDVTAMQTCAQGVEGINLHSENIQLAQELGIQASPTWFVNNKYEFSGLDAKTVQAEICKYNPDLKGCGVDLSGVSSGASVPAGSCN